MERFFWLKFSGSVQRRGVHVNTPKLGSRDGGNCFGGIWGSYADLRRKIFWGNLDLEFFGGLVESPRRCTEEGGTTLCFLGELFGELPGNVV
jgi:hypothetical protein